MKDVIVYEMHNLSDMKVCISDNCATDKNLQISFSKSGNIYPIFVNGSAASIFGKDSVSLKCYEEIGVKPFHLVSCLSEVLVISGLVDKSDNSVKIICGYRKSGNGEYFMVKYNSNRYIINQSSIYDGLCKHVMSRFEDDILKMVLKNFNITMSKSEDKVTRFFIYDKDNNAFSVWIEEKDSIEIGYSEDVEVSYSVEPGNDVQFYEKRAEMIPSDYIDFLNALSIVLSKAGKVGKCTLLNARNGSRKSKFIRNGNVVSCVTLDERNEGIDKCVMVQIDARSQHENVVVTDEMDKLFKDYELDFTPEMVANAALKLMYNMENKK